MMRRLYNTLMAVALMAASLSAGAQTVEYFWDTDPGVGKGTVLQRFTGNEAQVDTELDASGLSTGIHLLGLRVINDDTSAAATLGIVAHSATYYRQFYVPAPEETVTRIEYAWDTDPGVGKGRALSFTNGSTIDLSKSLSTKGLTEGIHTLYLRTLSTNHYSMTYTRQFYVPATPRSVKAIEYFFDEDPGVGNAIRKAATVTGDELTLAFDVNTDGLSEGVHHIGLRTLTDGTWSATKVRQFLVRSVADNDIVRLEYFWNKDPGTGNGLVVDVTPGKEVTLDFEADMTDLPEGTHTLGLRAMSGSGGWSATSLVMNIENEIKDDLQEYLNSLIDTEDVLSTTVYKRQFLNSDWQSLYVPFALNYSEWVDRFDIAKFTAFKQYDDDGDGSIDRQELEAEFIRSGSLQANYPYLIRAKQKGTTLTIDASRATSKMINAIDLVGGNAMCSLIGNYSQQTGLKSAHYYRMQGGSLSIPTSDSEVLPPYRWYMTIYNTSAREIHLSIVDGEATTISIPQTSNGTPSQVYDLSGRHVAVGSDTPLKSLPKGVYIINNRKCVVK